jgi:hypothetical protein
MLPYIDRVVCGKTRKMTQNTAALSSLKTIHGVNNNKNIRHILGNLCKIMKQETTFVLYSGKYIQYFGNNTYKSKFYS